MFDEIRNKVSGETGNVLNNEAIKKFISEGILDNFKSFALDNNFKFEASYILINGKTSSPFFYFSRNGERLKRPVSIYEMLNYDGNIPLLIYANFKDEIYNWERKIIEFCKEENKQIIIAYRSGEISSCLVDMEGQQLTKFKPLADLTEMEI